MNNKVSLSGVSSVADIIRQHGSSETAGTAIDFEGREISFADIHNRSSKVANGLISAGVKPQQTVAYLGLNTPEYFEIVFGAAKANCITVGVNWRLAPPEIAFTLKDAEVRVLIVAPELFPKVEAIESELGDSVLIIALGIHDRWQDYESWVAAQAWLDPQVPVASSDVAFLTYTSGTTGLPKGAMMSQQGFFAAFSALDSWRLDRQSVSLAMMPMFHFSGSGWSLLNLGLGCRVILLKDFDPADIVNAIRDHNVTNVIMPPVLIQAVMAILASKKGNDRYLGSLRAICYGGSPISKDVLSGAARLLGCELIQLYGLTETAGGIAQLDFEDHDPVNRPELLQSCGKPFPWVELKIVDYQTGKEVPAGEPGEIWARAPQNMIGYWNNPEATSQTITPEGWLRTGDIGRQDDSGYLFLLDRANDMIVSGAENVYPIEVEQALMKHPEVIEAAVFGVPDPRWGEAVRAAVVKAEGSDISAEQLIHDLRANLAGYKLPKSIDFIEALPRNDMGKVLRRTLREPFWAKHERAIG